MSRSLKTAATTELLEQARGLSGDFDKLSQAVSERTGLSPTELLAMDLIGRNGSIGAGQLARDLHLTTGAVTGLIDRLDRAGFARRAADPNDRRRVLVTATARERRIGELYGPLAATLRRTIDGYSEEEAATLIDFIRKLRSVVASTAEAVRRRSGA